MSAEQETAFGMPIIGPTHPRQQCETMVQQYATAWTAIPAAERQQLVQQALTPTVVYVDKLAHVTGSESLVRHIEMFQSQLPGASFTITGLAMHHSYCRVDYVCVDGSGKAVLEGTDIMEFAEDGRISKIIGFY